MSFDLFKETLPSLNLKTEHLLDGNPFAEPEYAKHMFLVNRAFSFSIDCLEHAINMNNVSDIDAKMHYDYYFYAVERRKRWDKWVKPKELNNLDVVKEYYSCSSKKAKEYLRILNDEQLKHIRDTIHKGKPKK